MIFVASLDGKAYATEAKSTNCVKNTYPTNAFHHYAVTWNKGAVKFFCDGVAMGGGTIGSAGSAKIYNSSAPLIVGKPAPVASQGQSTELYLDANIDDLRIGQGLRWSAAFTVPTAAAAAD